MTTVRREGDAIRTSQTKPVKWCAGGDEHTATVERDYAEPRRLKDGRTYLGEVLCTVYPTDNASARHNAEHIAKALNASEQNRESDPNLTFIDRGMWERVDALLTEAGFPDLQAQCVRTLEDRIRDVLQANADLLHKLAITPPPDANDCPKCRGERGFYCPVDGAWFACSDCKGTGRRPEEKAL